MGDHPWGFLELKESGKPLSTRLQRPIDLIAENDLLTVRNELDLDCLLVAPAATATLQECILLIEDDKDAMLLVRYSLQAYGEGRFNLKWVESLSERLEQLSKGGADIILLDLGLPDRSGLSTLASIREAPPGVPTLVLTGDKREETEFAAAAWGVDGYLVKDQVLGVVQAIRVLIDARNLQKCHGRPAHAPIASAIEPSELVLLLPK
jgi:CheY-like chemotaxis protein